MHFTKSFWLGTFTGAVIIAGPTLAYRSYELKQWTEQAEQQEEDFSITRAKLHGFVIARSLKNDYLESIIDLGKFQYEGSINSYDAGVTESSGSCNATFQLRMGTEQHLNSVRSLIRDHLDEFERDFKLQSSFQISQTSAGSFHLELQFDYVIPWH